MNQRQFTENYFLEKVEFSSLDRTVKVRIKFAHTFLYVTPKICLQHSGHMIWPSIGWGVCGVGLSDPEELKLILLQQLYSNVNPTKIEDKSKIKMAEKIQF